MKTLRAHHRKGRVWLAVMRNLRPRLWIVDRHTLETLAPVMYDIATHRLVRP